MHVAIIDYGSGNLHSAAKAFERAAREGGSPLAVKVTADPELVRVAERIVLPGVGAFADCRNGLTGIPGMIEALEESVRAKGKPFLGICVGLQLMAERGLEHGLTPGLGWIEGEVRKLAEQLNDCAGVLPLDVQDDAQVASAVAGAADALGGAIHTLVHAVAYAKPEDLGGRFVDTSRDGFHLAVDVSAYSLTALAREAEQ